MRRSIPGLRKDAIKAMIALALIALAMTPVMPHIIAIMAASQSFKTGNPAWLSGGSGYAKAGAAFAGTGVTLVIAAIVLRATLPALVVAGLASGGVILIGIGIAFA